MEHRLEQIAALHHKYEFHGRLFCLGMGAVAQCTLPIIFHIIKLDPKKVVIMDFVDNSAKIAQFLQMGATYIVQKVTEQNYKSVLDMYLQEGDFLLDLSWNIETVHLLEHCHKRGVLFLNTSVEEYEPYHPEKIDPCRLTLYARQMHMLELQAKLKKEPSKNSTITNATAVVDHGANPGLVSHFTKRACCDIVEHLHKNGTMSKSTYDQCAQWLKNGQFNMVAQVIGLKTIHIAERDTQVTSKPKMPNEFVNTWSIPGFIEESQAPAELGWGTHELQLPIGAMQHDFGPKNQILLPSRGLETKVRSWVPSGPIIGFVVRHGEAFGISERFTVWNDDDSPAYRPTVHYAYCPCDSAIASLHELEMRNFQDQPKQRIMHDDIIAGADELGCLLMGDFGSWWIGSLLDIEETRKIMGGQNATTLQVACSAVSAMISAMKQPNRGLLLPDDLDHKEILDVAMPYLGTFISKPVEWTPYGNIYPIHDKKKKHVLPSNYEGNPEDFVLNPKDKHAWQFQDFLFAPVFNQ